MSAKSTFQKVQSFIKATSMLDKGMGVVIALSGGPDSIALLDMFIRLQKALRKNRKHPQEIKLHIAHLNHQLRGKAADDDAEFVRRLAENLAVPVTLETIDIQKFAEKTGKGIEVTARLARYKFLHDTAMTTGCDRIATGHTMNDQAETFLMRLVRGAGLRGLASMRPVIPAHQFNKESGVWNQESGVREPDSEFTIPNSPVTQQTGSQQILHCTDVEPATDNRRTRHRLPTTDVLLIRPLLCITREEVEAYCAQRKLIFRVDATNQSLDYTRNRIRHQALKILGEINPRVVEHLGQTAETIAADEEALDELAKGSHEKARLNSMLGQQDKKGSAYSVKEIVKHPLGLRRRLLMEAIRHGRAKLSATRSQVSEIEMAHIKSIARLLEDDASGHRVRLPDGLEVWREFDALVLMPGFISASPSLLDPTSLADKPGEGQVCQEGIAQKEQVIQFGEFSLRIKREQDIALLKTVIEGMQEEKNRTRRDWLTVALDDSILPVPLIIRTRQTGEKVLVVGQRKIKKLKNLMIDHKIAASHRATWPVVATSDGQYVWSPGLPPAIKFAANDKTLRLAIIEASNIEFLNPLNPETRNQAVRKKVPEK